MFAALLTAAAPPPTTMTDRAAASRWCGGAQVGADLVRRLQRRLPPEAVGDTGGDDERVVRIPVVEPSASCTATVRAARSTPVRVPCTARTRSRPRKRPNGIQLCRAQSSGRANRQPSSCPVTSPGLAEMPTTSRVPGQLDRGQHPGVAQPGDDDAIPRCAPAAAACAYARPAAAAARTRGTRSMTSW